MTTYTLQALDADGHPRAVGTLPDGVTTQQIGEAILLRVPDHWPLSQSQALAAQVQDAAGDGVTVIAVPSYVVALRLAPADPPEPPAEWRQA